MNLSEDRVGLSFPCMSPSFHLLAFNYVSRVATGVFYLNTLFDHELLVVDGPSLKLVLESLGIEESSVSVFDSNLPTIDKRVVVGCLCLTENIPML